MHQRSFLLVRSLLVCVQFVGLAAMSSQAQGLPTTQPQTQEQKPLTNVDILRMVDAGLAESTITLAIKSNKSNFDTSPQALIEMKNKGVSPNILNVMLGAKTEKITAVPSAQQTGIKDPSEYNSYIGALGQSDPHQRTFALEAFLTKYSGTVVREYALEHLMVSYRQCGDASKATETANKVLQINPNNILALVNLTYYTRLRAGQNPDQALQLINQAAQFAQQSLRALQSNPERPDLNFEKLKASSLPLLNATIEQAAVANRRGSIPTKSDEDSPRAQGNPATLPTRGSSQTGNSAQSGAQQKTIKDPTEYNAYLAALGQTDPHQKASALEFFLTQYAGSVVKEAALEQLMVSYQQAKDIPKTTDAANRVLQINPNNLRALVLLTYFSRLQAQQNPAQSQQLMSQAAQYAERGLQALQGKQSMPDPDFEKLKAASLPIFYAAKGSEALATKDYPTAQQALRSAVDANPNNVQDVYPLALSFLQSKPNVQQLSPYEAVNGLWYMARAVNLTAANPTAQQQIAKAGQYYFTKYHGSEDGWQQLVAQAASTPYPPMGLNINVGTPPPPPTRGDQFSLQVVRSWRRGGDVWINIIVAGKRWTLHCYSCPPLDPGTYDADLGKTDVTVQVHRIGDDVDKHRKEKYKIYSEASWLEPLQ